MIYKMELSDSVDTMVFDLLEVPIVDKDITGIAENTTIDGNVFNDYLWLKKQYVQKWSIMCQDEYDRLRGFWTRQFGNAEVPFYRLFYGENVYEDKNFLTSDGFTQIMNPTERTAPLSLTHLYGNAEQKTLSGKNIFDIDQGVTEFTSYAGNVVSNWGTYSDGVLTMTTSNGQNGFVGFSGFTPTIVEGTTYTLSADVYLSGTAGSTAIRVGISPNTSSSATFIASKDTWISFSKSYTAVAADVADPRLCIEAWSTGNTLKVKNLQLEIGNQATPYEPYCGGIPSPNPDFPQVIKTVSGAQTVKITGKNLCTNAFVKDSSNVQFNCDIASISGNRIALSAILDVATSSNSVYAHVDGVNTGVRLGSFTGPANGVGSSIIYDLSQIASYLENGKELQLILYKSGAGFTSVSDAMIVNGDTLQDYEPYQAQSQEINLGKNLLPITATSTTINGTTFTVNDDGSITVSGTPSAQANFTLSSFVISPKEATIISSNTMPTGASVVCKKTTNGTATYPSILYAPSATTHQLATDSTYEQFVLRIGTTFAGTTTFKLQIEAGTRATPYAPYKTPIELAKIGTYQDYIWNDDGTWKIHKAINKIVLDGTENWAFATMFYCTSPLQGIAECITPSGGNIICDNYTYRAGAGIAPSIDIVGAYIIRIRDTDFADISALTTWLSAHNTTVYYPLATPTETEITDSELIEQLNHIYSLYQGQNNLWLIPSAGAQGEIDGTYRLIYDEETDIIPKTPVVLTLTDGGVINPCGCRQNIQLIMRETEGE